MKVNIIFKKHNLNPHDPRNVYPNTSKRENKTYLFFLLFTICVLYVHIHVCKCMCIYDIQVPINPQTYTNIN